MQGADVNLAQNIKGLAICAAAPLGSERTDGADVAVDEERVHALLLES